MMPRWMATKATSATTNHGERAPDSRYLLASAVYAYALLFPGPQGETLDASDPRVRLAYDLYNRGLTAVVSEEVGKGRRVLPLPFGELELDWKKYVRVDPKFLRPAEVDHLIGDASKGRAALGWHPEVSFRALVQMMVDADLTRLSSQSRTPAGVESR